MERQESRRKLKCAIFGNPGTLHPFELNSIISNGNLKNITIKRENSSLIIPNETLKEITSMRNERIKAILMTSMLKAMQEATELRLDYETNIQPPSQDISAKPEVF